MLIQTESTPNPSALKFTLDVTIMLHGTSSFLSKEEANISPLAKQVFAVEGVRSVLLGSNFVTVTKEEETSWSVLKPAILYILAEYSSKEEVTTQEHPASLCEDREIVKRICELLDTRVRPTVARDGGDIIFHGFCNGVVLLRLQGSCSGCPSATATLKNGVENLLRHYIPEVTAVQAV